MLLPPPGRFSTKKDCPSRSVSHCAMKRATRSVPPPAEVATRMRTGRDGYVSAPAMRAARGSAARPSRRSRRATNAVIGGTSRRSLEHFPEKWTSGFPKKMRPRKRIWSGSHGPNLSVAAGAGDRWLSARRRGRHCTRPRRNGVEVRMMFHIPRLTSVLLIAVLSLSSSPTIGADDYPSRPIKLMVGASPGGTTDTMARAIAPPLASALGRPVLVANSPGAGGNLAADAVAKAVPDGYSLLVCFTSHTINATLYR